MATAEANFDAEPSEELAAQRRARYVRQVRGRASIFVLARRSLASPRDTTDAPSDEELLAFLDVVYGARRIDP